MHIYSIFRIWHCTTQQLLAMYYVLWLALYHFITVRSMPFAYHIVLQYTCVRSDISIYLLPARQMQNNKRGYELVLALSCHVKIYIQLTHIELS